MEDAGKQAVGALDFGSADLANVQETVTREFSLMLDGVLPLVFISLFLFCVLYSYSKAKTGEAGKSGANWPKISIWPSALRWALLPLLSAYALTHAFSAATVYFNTKVFNPSTFAYFEAMGVGRLTALTHAHLFAHATMYFILAVLVQFTSAGNFTKILAPLVALWAGVFDVFSWWGIKEVSTNFEWLSAINGSAFSIAFLMMSYALLREAFRKN